MNINSNPIVIRMAGGLANRMFQYSYYLYLKDKGYNVYVDNNYRAHKWKMEDISWERIFPKAILCQANKLTIFKYGGGYDLLSKIRRHYLKFTTVVYQMPDAYYCPTNQELKRNFYLIGIFQNAQMVDSIKEEICKHFVFKPFLDNYNLSFVEKLMGCNSVSIHVRKGKDYRLRPDYQGTCNTIYYKRAIAFMRSKIEDPNFFVFTDNPEWVKENFDWFSYELVDGNPSVGWGNHFDMQLMSCCKHNIIANSTYSWWGAYLNPNKEKIVIGPKYWFNKDMEQHSGLENKTLCKDWIAL